MGEWLIIGVLFLAGVVSCVLTSFIRHYALSKNLLDIPNHRSSHSMPTPRGGGVAIVLVVAANSLLFWWMDLLSSSELWMVLGPGGMVALVGWLDDHSHVATNWRLLIHFAAALWAVIWIGGLPPLVFFGINLDLGWLTHILATVYLVWLINLYNFMDGIDGIAGVEAITVCLGGAILYTLSSESGHKGLLPVLVAVTVIGFLVWNYPIAKIFLGDVGSGFIGIILGVFSIQAAWIAPELFWGWIILLGLFVVDATVTLVRRALRGQNVSEAHRSHAYQYAARKFKTHSPVTLFFGATNLLWLLPIAILVVRDVLDGALAVAIAYMPLIVLAIKYKAGAKELQEV